MKKFEKEMIVNLSKELGLSERIIKNLKGLCKPENNLYILKVHSHNANPLYKFGYSSNILNRMFQYYQHNPYIILCNTFRVHKAFEIENLIHKSFKSIVLNEWYEEETILQIEKILSQLSLKEIDHLELESDLIFNEEAKKRTEDLLANAKIIIK